MKLIIDASSFLNFLASSQQGILISLSERVPFTLCVPEQVEKEILGQAKAPRFQGTPVASTWKKISENRVAILNDDITNNVFSSVIGRMSGKPAKERVKDKPDLGEIMVIAHASVEAQNNQDVTILMDESNGRRKAMVETNWIKTQSSNFGMIRLASTPQILNDAQAWGIVDRWEDSYQKLQVFDDGLPRDPYAK